MLVISEQALRAVEAALISATHDAVDHNGEKVILGTIDDKRLESAALAAMVVATGEVCFPATKRLVVKRPKVQAGPITHED